MHMQQASDECIADAQVHIGYKALNRIHNSTRRDIGPSPAGCLAVRMRHFLSTYLSFLMGRLEFTHAAQLQQVGHSSLVLPPSDTSDPVHKAVACFHGNDIYLYARK